MLPLYKSYRLRPTHSYHTTKSLNSKSIMNGTAYNRFNPSIVYLKDTSKITPNTKVTDIIEGNLRFFPFVGEMVLNKGKYYYCKIPDDSTITIDNNSYYSTKLKIVFIGVK